MIPQIQASDEVRGVEKRRYKRTDFRLNAIFTLKGMDSMVCEIQNFCEGGVLLAYQGHSISQTILIPLKNQPIKVEFAARHRGRNERFVAKGNVVRISATRIGVAFAEKPPEASFLEALFAAAKSGHQQFVGPVLPDNKTVRLVDGCLDTISQSLHQILEVFHRDIEGKLVDAANQSKSNFLDNAYREAIIELKADRQNLEKKLCSAVIDSFKGRCPEKKHLAAPKVKIPIEQKKLALIDQNKFEDWLNISEVIDHSRNGYEKELKELSGKISFLAEQSSGQASNPVSPDSICEVFWDAIKKHGFDYKIRNSIYKIFESALNANLGGLYNHLLSLTAEIQPVVMTSENATNHPSPGPGDPGQSFQAAQIQPRQFPRDSKIQRDFSSIANKLIDLESAESQQGACPNQPFSIGQKQVPGSQNQRPVENFTKEQILSAINSLYKSSGHASSSKPIGQVSESEVLAFLSKGLPDTPDQTLGEKTNIKIVGKFFEGLASETYGSPGMQTIMQKMELPFLNLALESSEFLNSKTHPARYILDLLDKISGVANSNGRFSKTIEHQLLHGVVRQFANSTPQSHEQFVEIGKKLERIAGPIEKTRIKNIRRVQEACEGNQKARSSRLRVEKLISKLLGGKNVPKILVELLTAGWKHLLILHDTKEGQNSPSQRKGIEIIVTLLAWMSEDEKYEQSDERKARDVLNFIDAELSTVCTDVREHFRIMKELTSCVIGEGNPKVRKSPEMVSIPKRTVAKKNKDEYSINPKLYESIHQVKQLKIGDWLLFLFGENQNEPVNLAWIGGASASYVFTDRKGLKKLEIPLARLARLIRKGAVMKVEGPDIPLTDRVTNHMLQAMHEKLIHQAAHDDQTGLINRKQFVKVLEYELAGARNFQTAHTLCYLQIDQIMLICNSCPEEAGRNLFQDIARILNHEINDRFTAARLGDETFGVLMKDCSEKEAVIAAKRLSKSIGEFEFKWEDKVYVLSSSIGLASITDQTESIIDVLKHAGNACLTAKTASGNRIQIYRDNDNRLKRQEEIVEWAGRIGKVLSENRIELRCQLIAPVRPENNQHSHYEILLAVRDEQGKINPPDSFIPSAERCNRMLDIDKWVVTNVFKWIESNKKKFDRLGGFAINLSGQSINSNEFLEFLKRELSAREIIPEKICFEITETAAVSDLSFAQNFITQIKRYGCAFSLDDFGSGFSSYSYLKNLDVDYLKIDGVFVKDLATSQSDLAMVRSMNEIGHSLGIKTIAEYVEDEEILEKLADIGVDFAQGYGIKTPFPISEL